MRIEHFIRADLAIQIHLLLAILALIIGLIVLIRPKGTLSHKIGGRSFVGLMIVVALTAIFIQKITPGHYSWIHLFIPLTFFASFSAVWYIRKGDVKRHKRAVFGLFFGALLIPGFFAFMPGRLMWNLFFS